MALDDRTRPLRPGVSVRPTSPPRVPGWILGRKLGEGGFGDVHEAEEASTGQPAALKILHAQFVTSPEMLARFDREVRVLERLQHPNVAKIYATGFDETGRPYLCMELLTGNDLATVIAQRGSLAPGDAHRVLEALCDALAAAHELGIVHRDLKASNVFVCEDSRIVLLDFGIAKLSDALAPELTASHQSLGTPGAMAPEQIHGGRVDHRADIYALGVLLFHMLTGRSPFADPSETMMQYLHLHARRPRVSAVVPVPERVDDVVIRAMAIEPDQRFESVHALLAALRVALRDSLHAASKPQTMHAAIFATVVDETAGAALDAALLDDLEAVLPRIERCLAAAGFTPILDLGSSMLFVSASDDPETAVRTVLTAWEDIERRPGADPRVRIGFAVHRVPATVRGNRVEPGPIVRPDTWGLPDPLEGVWITAAFSQGGRRLR